MAESVGGASSGQPPNRDKEEAKTNCNGEGGRNSVASSASGGGGGGNTVLLTDDMLYKLSKKIAQLTKVKQ